MFLRRVFSGFVLHAGGCIGRLYDDNISTSRQLLVFSLGSKIINYLSMPPSADGLMAMVPRRWPRSNGKGRRYVGLITYSVINPED